MIAYLDASVILRVVFDEPNRLAEWSEVELGVASELARVECLRTIDRERLRLRLNDEEVALRSEAVYSVLEHLQLIDLSSEVLQRASQPFPTGLGTLDSIHLASALLWSQRSHRRLVMTTHDAELGRAARATGMAVLGV